MSPFLFLLFVFANALLLNSISVGAVPPSISAESPSARKLGKHQSSSVVGFLSPTEAPRSEMKVQGTSTAASGGEIQLGGNHEQRHKSRDKSIAGGGVILGGLATTFLVAIICYIRATRRQNAEENSAASETTCRPRC